MTADTKTLTPTTPAVPAAAAAGKAPQAAKPATRSKTPRKAQPATAKPVAKPATAAAKKTTRRRAAAVKPTPAKKVAQATKPAAAPKAGKPAKAKKVKLVRDSFTMPETEYALIALLKKRCLDAGVSAKKSEILRAAVAGLAKLGDASVVAAIRRLDVIKTGRPAKVTK